MKGTKYMFNIMKTKTKNNNNKKQHPT